VQGNEGDGYIIAGGGNDRVLGGPGRHSIYGGASTTTFQADVVATLLAVKNETISYLVIIRKILFLAASKMIILKETMETTG
jgi:Ca2+-binding RTX toxin-like protein